MLNWFWPGGHRALDILSTFCSEAAVLVIVFGPLDFFIATQEPGHGVHPVPLGLVVRWSAISCLAFLILSIWFAGMGGNFPERKKKEG